MDLNLLNHILTHDEVKGSIIAWYNSYSMGFSIIIVDKRGIVLDDCGGGEWSGGKGQIFVSVPYMEVLKDLLVHP